MLHQARLRGTLSNLGSLLIVLIVWVQGGNAPLNEASWLLAAIGLSVNLGGWILQTHPRLGRGLASLGLVGAMAVAATPLSRTPASALAGGLLSISLLLFIWSSQPAFPMAFPARAVSAGQLVLSRFRICSSMAVLSWLLAVVARLASGPVIWMALGVAFVIPLVMTIRWQIRVYPHHPHKRRLLIFHLTIQLALTIFAWGQWSLILGWGVLLPLFVWIYTSSRASLELTESGRWSSSLFSHPARLLVLTFLGLCTFGTLILLIPICSSRAGSISLIDAAFTAVSAVCVTGLIVLDTPLDFTPVGQFAILLLIQLGGLGIMTFSLALFRLMGLRLSIRHESAMAGLISGENRGELFRSLSQMLWITFVAEAAGAVLLTGFFLFEGDTFLKALWRGVFTSVSAFCNAGFALQSDSLMGYQQDAGILQVVALLIILGGLSPSVIASFSGLFRDQVVVLHTRVIVATTLLLLVGGAVAIAAVEWNNTLLGLNFWDRLSNAWFQSVTLRTAGFNSIDIAGARAATFSLMVVWMFIGGSPGGTAGGVKTTTAAVLLLAVAATMRGHSQAAAFGRRIAHQAVYKAAAVVTVGAVAVGLGLISLQLTQTLSGPAAFFEVVSALGTVGLSVGGTSQLDGIGKIIIMVCMFLGRVGPLTLFVFLAGRPVQPLWELAEGEIEVG